MPPIAALNFSLAAGSSLGLGLLALLLIRHGVAHAHALLDGGRGARHRRPGTCPWGAGAWTCRGPSWPPWPSPWPRCRCRPARRACRPGRRPPRRGPPPCPRGPWPPRSRPRSRGPHLRSPPRWPSPPRSPRPCSPPPPRSPRPRGRRRRGLRRLFRLLLAADDPESEGRHQRGHRQIHLHTTPPALFCTRSDIGRRAARTISPRRRSGYGARAAIQTSTGTLETSRARSAESAQR
jgi:hypothetical protein